ncbi:MAG: HAMP domain-containing histidine kinase [Syntrophomonadaceae bacterium]|nr:HAMP domain-containing histidine kinase [Syntrophomonadaceae bacterium]
MKIKKVWARFFISYVAVILLTMMVWGAASSIFIKGYLLRYTEENLMRSGEEINRILDILGPDQLNVSFMRMLISNYNGEIYLTDQEGIVVASSLNEENVGTQLSSEIMASISSGEVVSQEVIMPGQENGFLTVITPIIQADQVSGAIVLATPIEEIETAIQEIQSTVIRASLIALLLGAVVSIGVAFGMTTQVREITRGITHFAKAEFDYHIPVITTDELGDMALSFNEMAGKISSLMERRRRLLAGISHDLRTPLTNIRGYIEALSDRIIPPQEFDQTLDLIHKETVYMGKVLGDIIDLSRMEIDQLRLNKTDFSLSNLTNKVAMKLEQLAINGSNRIMVSCPDDIIIRADEVRIEQLLTNLVKNALQFTKNGIIEVVVGHNGNQVKIVIKDDGIGIEEDQIPFLFDSFYKIDPSRSNSHTESGLGLSIVQSIVKLHNGTIDIESQIGKGTVVTVLLPVA